MTKKVSDKNFDTPMYKVTGHTFDGRVCLDTGDKWLVRMPPKFFNYHQSAHAYLEHTMFAGILWKLVSSMSEDEYQYDIQKYKPEGSYGIIKLKNMSWPMGVRAGNNQYTPLKNLQRMQETNKRYENKYPSSKYNSWRSEGRKNNKKQD